MNNYKKDVKSRTIAIFLTFSALICNTGCGENTDKPPVKNELQVNVVDNSRIYKKSQVEYPDRFQTISDIFFNENSGKIYIIGSDSEGNISCCVTDESFSAYTYADLEICPDIVSETVSFAFSGDSLFALISKADLVENAEITPDTSYSYTLNIYDDYGKKISSTDFTLTDNLLSDIAGKAVWKLTYIGENKLYMSIGGISFVTDFSGNIIEVVEDYEQNHLVENYTEYVKYQIDNSGYFKVNPDKSMEKLIDFADSGFNGISQISPISNGNFLCCMGGSLYKLSEMDEAEIAEIKEITLAIASNGDMIQPVIADFNSDNNGYRINLKNYSENYEYSAEGMENAVKDLEMDIISGKIPDMVYLDTNEINKLSSKGAFADLYQFIDNDKVYSREAFLPNYLEATETDGKLFSIAPTFMVRTIATKSRYTDISNWTYEEFTDAYNSLPADMELFEMGNNRNAVFSFLTGDCSNFFDYKTHSCTFDSQDFINILKFSAEFPSVEEYDFENKSCRNDTALLSAVYIKSFRDFNVQKQSIFGDNMTFVGTPSADRNGSSILLANQFAIMEKSPEKDGAWQFIRSMLSDERYSGNIDGIPVTENGLALAMAEALEPPYYLDENGKKMTMPETGLDSYTNKSINITPMTKEEQAKYADFLRNITKSTSGNYDSSINSIADEETAIFFANGCTAEECADNIQKRVSLMLSETA